MSRSSRRIPLKVALLATLVVMVAAVSSTAAQAASLPTVSVAVTKTSGTITGALESGAVNVVSSDTGLKEGDVILVLLKPGLSFAEAEAFIKAGSVQGDPNNASKVGKIVFDIEVNPGATNETQTDLAAGEYLLLIGGPKGEPALRQTFTVAASAAPVALPAAQATIRSIEFGFKGPSKLHDGEVVAFENEGFLVHMDLAFPVKNMKSAKLAVKDLRSGKEKGLGKLITGEPVTFAGPLSSDAMQQETITAKPGIYVQVCFMATQDKRSHTLLGMERIITITK
jgi:hypothetical protein